MLASYSYSSLDTFRVCPRKFKFAYIDKIKVPPKIMADTYLGNAVHRVLRELYTLGADGVLMSLDDAIKAYQGEWDKVDRKLITVSSEYYTVDDYIRIGQELLTRHYEHYRPFNQGTLIGAELHLTFELANTPFKFRSFIDRLWKRDDGVVEICDYKTGQNMTLPTEPRFLYQMGIYQMAVEANYPQFERIELAQYFLRKNEIVSSRLRADELDQLKEQLRVAVVESIHATKMNDFPAQEGIQCTYCDYHNICPAKIHHQVLTQVEEPGATPEIPARDMKALADEYLAKYARSRELNTELESLKEKLIELARQFDVSRIEGDLGRVSVSVATKEEFVTKTRDEAAFAELSALSRQLGLDEYFTLDTRGLMKEVYQKKRLAREQLELLEKFVVQVERSRVTARLKAESDNEADEQ